MSGSVTSMESWVAGTVAINLKDPPLDAASMLKVFNPVEPAAGAQKILAPVEV